jgi:hypothetical protein
LPKERYSRAVYLPIVCQTLLSQFPSADKKVSIHQIPSLTQKSDKRYFEVKRVDDGKVWLGKLGRNVEPFAISKTTSNTFLNVSIILYSAKLAKKSKFERLAARSPTLNDLLTNTLLGPSGRGRINRPRKEGLLCWSDYIFTLNHSLLTSTKFLYFPNGETFY